MSKLKTINIKGKQYVTVNERLKAFREGFEEYTLETELVSVDSASALIRAVIKDPSGRIIATGTAFERADQKGSLVNATSHVENCETSAWGRALGNFGIGIDDSVATADEVTNAAKKPPYTPPVEAPKKKPTLDQVKKAMSDCKVPHEVETVLASAKKYPWTDAEALQLNEMYKEALNRVLPI